MSWKYPNQCGTRNAEANRKWQRYSHTVWYHTRHQIREAGRSPDPVDPPPPVAPAGVARPGGLAAVGRVIGDLPVPQLVVGALVVVAVGYGGYRLYRHFNP